MIAQVLLDLKSKRRRVEHTSLDVFVVHNLKTLDDALREAIGTLSGRLLPRRKRARRHEETLVSDRISPSKSASGDTVSP